MYQYVVSQNCQATGTGTGDWDWGLGLGTGIGDLDCGTREWGMQGHGTAWQPWVTLGKCQELLISFSNLGYPLGTLGIHWDPWVTFGNLG